MQIFRSTDVSNQQNTKQCVVLSSNQVKVVVRYVVENGKIAITWTSKPIPNRAMSYLQVYLSGREF